jgi:hypothetical protein
VCVYVCMYVCMYVRMYVCIYVSMYMCIYVCMYVCKSMELSSSCKSLRFLANQVIPRILWKLKVHYRTHNSPLIVPNLSQMNLMHVIPSYLCKIHFNIILNLRLGLPSGLLPLSFPTETLYAFLFSPPPHIRH